MQIFLIGRWDISYTGGLFFLNLIFPENYPEEPPEVTFLTPIYHPNVNSHKLEHSNISLGYVGVNFFSKWYPETSVREIITRLYSIFYLFTTDCGFCLKMSDEKLIIDNYLRKKLVIS